MSSQLDEKIQAENAAVTSRKAGNNNALTHGGTSRKLILPGENTAEFESLLEGIREEYQPETRQQHLFVEQLAMAHWLLWRRQRAYNAIESSVYESAGSDPELGASECLNEAHFHRLNLADRYRTGAERALKRALANAESIRKERKSERDTRERRSRWEAEQELRERRLEIGEEQKKAAAARRRERAEREAAENPPPKPPIQWPEGRIGQPVSKEEYDQALADAQALWDSMSGHRKR